MSQRSLFYPPLAQPLVLILVLVLAVVVHLQLGPDLPLAQQWLLVSGQLDAVELFDVVYLYSHLPRLVMALLVGATLGMVGSLMQQLTQNPLTSPLTLGTASGAWLALLILNVWFQPYVAQFSPFAAMFGALLALGLVIGIAGPRNITGLPLVLAGMVVNILLGAIATAIILLNDHYARNVFIWGAGDLAQNGWEWVQWLLPKLSVAIPLLLIAPRVLALMRLGQQGAAARGLNVIPTFIGLLLVGLWLVSSAITAVGVISFIGLLTPNLVRSFGMRTPRAELYASMIMGATLLLVTDAAAMALDAFTVDSIPSGVMAAALGAPALIAFSRRRLKAQDNLSIQLPPGRARLAPATLPLLLVLLVAVVAISTLVNTDGQQWYLVWPDPFTWALQWPRLLTAASAGIALALSGTLLQRLIYNPLASPDILGISAGATFALVITSIMAGGSLVVSQSSLAFVGSLAVLALILVLGKRHNYAPSSLILIGIAITAMIEALVQFALAQGSENSYSIVRWLAGSTYRVSPEQALILAAGTAVMATTVLALHRWISLISAGREFAAARGLNVPVATITLLGLVALLCALVTASMGPVAFVGLLAPHMAVMLGAKRVVPQLLVAALLGAVLMLSADWLGQVILFPMQIAAGTLVSVIGGSYFLLLLIRGRNRT